MIDLDQIKKLREQTGAGIADIKEALEKAKGDEKAALAIIKQKGLDKAAKKIQRETKAGVIDSYIHHTLNSGATVVLTCETDFVARNPDFKQLAHDIATQGTATLTDNVSQLLDQPWIKDESKTVRDLINENIAKFGENIKIKEIKKFQI